MFTKVKTAAVAATLIISPVAVSAITSAPAHAAKNYANCDALHRDFKYGVAKSKAAAQKQVRDGYHRPAFKKKARAVYRENNGPLDRDNDGTACEA